MNYEKALSAAILGDRVRHDGMQPGAYLDYHFNGWRINFPGGSSSGFTPREADYFAKWERVPFEHEIVRDSWGRPVAEQPKTWDEVFSDLDKGESGSYVDRKQIDRATKWGGEDLPVPTERVTEVVVTDKWGKSNGSDRSE